MRELEFWDFSLSRYARHGVPPLFLALQDEHGADVNLVLFALWLGARQMEIPDRKATGIVRRHVYEWHEHAVKPLRHTRRWLKGRAFPDPQARDTLRAAIQKSEIEAERLEQMLLQNLFDTDGDSFTSASADAAETLMRTNALFFCRDTGDPAPLVGKLVSLCL